MSTPQQPRRRRIAGESKPAVTPSRPTPPAGRAPRVPVRRPTPATEPSGPTTPTTPRRSAKPEPTPKAKATPKPEATSSDDRPGAGSRLSALGRQLNLRLALAIVVMLAGLAAAGLGYQHMQRSMPLSYDQAQDAADAAATAVQTIFTYDYRDLDSYADDTAGLVSPRYAEAEYDDLVEELRQQAVAAQAQMSTTVYAAATQPCDDDCDQDEARVLVIADRITLNAATPEPVVLTQRLQVDLVREDSQWLVDEVTYLGE